MLMFYSLKYFSKVSPAMAKMVRRKCAFCRDDEESAIMYIAEGQNLAVHQNCLVRFANDIQTVSTTDWKTKKDLKHSCEAIHN